MRVLAVVGLAALTLSCGGRNGAQGQAGAGTTLPVTHLTNKESGFASNSGYDSATTLLIGDTAGWHAAWQRLHAGRNPVPEPPTIDFSRESVVLVAIGTQPNGGHSVRISAVSLRGDTLLVRATHQVPAAECITTQALVEPVDLVLVPRTVLPTVAMVDTVTYRCGR